MSSRWRVIVPDCFYVSARLRLGCDARRIAAVRSVIAALEFGPLLEDQPHPLPPVLTGLARRLPGEDLAIVFTASSANRIIRVRAVVAMSP